MMAPWLLVFCVCGTFAVTLGLTVRAFVRRHREGKWRWATSIALIVVLAFAGLVALVTASALISAFGPLASADAASRATILARAISSALNAGYFAFVVCVPFGLVALCVLAYRFFHAKKRGVSK